MRQRKLLPSAARMEPFCRSGFVEAPVQFAPSLPIGRLPPPATSQGWNMCKPDVCSESDFGKESGQNPERLRHICRYWPRWAKTEKIFQNTNSAFWTKENFRPK